MLNYKRIGKQIAILRKDKGLTGEKLAEVLGVSPQAVSKWETGKCLPEANILPLLSKALNCSIDSILIPKELQILKATYGDGITSFDVTRFLDGLITSNKLNVIINMRLFGCDFNSDRLKILTVKYQIPSGIYLIYLRENDTLSLDVNEKGFDFESSLRIIGAYYGNERDFKAVINKFDHYDYFKQTELLINHETFPSSVYSDSVEYLTVIYINNEGIYVVSCKEEETLCFNRESKFIYVYDKSKESLALPNIMNLNWGEGMDCTWAGALTAALKYMGHDVSYEYIMGVSGACFRIAFTPMWDFSAVDALVVYDYAEPAYKAMGYELVWADRISKEQRNIERQNIIRDIKLGKPPIAINLRIAPEWGVITGYLENGNELLCRTYFDKAIFDANRENYEFQEEMKRSGGYLNADCWPFAIAHFGAKTEMPSEKQNLLNSLKGKVESMGILERRGYFIGFEAYKAWIDGLQNDNLFKNVTEQDLERRLQVNDYQLLNLLDARQCAARYLKKSINLLEGESAELLSQMADVYETMSDMLKIFYNNLQKEEDNIIGYMDNNLIQSKGVYSRIKRQEEANMLKKVLELEYKADCIAKKILLKEI